VVLYFLFWCSVSSSMTQILSSVLMFSKSFSSSAPMLKGQRKHFPPKCVLAAEVVWFHLVQAGVVFRTVVRIPLFMFSSSAIFCVVSWWSFLTILVTFPTFWLVLKTIRGHIFHHHFPFYLKFFDPHKTCVLLVSLVNFSCIVLQVRYSFVAVSQL
jgi:hypothetical protein